jgi:hypothetical protein
MSERVNPFASLSDAPAFTTKPKPDRPVEKEIIERIAEQNNFPSRQARAPKVERRKPRIYRTGRNQQLNAKATPETIQKFYKLADEKRVPLGELLRLALDAFESMEKFTKAAEERRTSVEELVKAVLSEVQNEETGGGRNF